MIGMYLGIRLEIRFPQSSNGKWLKNIGWHDYKESWN